MQALFAIKVVLQRPLMQKAFGSLVGGTRWTTKLSDTALRDSTRKEPTFSTLGMDSSIVGGHYEVFIADDIATGANMRTKHAREHAGRVWTEAVLPTIRPYGRVLVCGTRWHRDDIAGVLIEAEVRGEWDKVLTIRAIEEDEDGNRRSIWPALWPLKRLNAKRREMSERAFRAQFLMDPSGLGGGMYSEEMLNRYADVEDLPDQVRSRAVTCIGVDPAMSLGERADHTAVVAVTRIGDRYYVRECRRGKWSFSEIIAHTQAMAKRYGRIHWVVVESTQAQRVLVSDFKRYARELPVRAQDPLQMAGKSKEGRAMAYLRLFETDEMRPEPKVWFSTPTDENGIGRLQEEMAAFPQERGADDCVDALVYALRGFGISKTKLHKVRRRGW